MKMSMIALAAALSMGAAIPAFADQGPPVESNNSFPPGFLRAPPFRRAWASRRTASTPSRPAPTAP